MYILHIRRAVAVIELVVEDNVINVRYKIYLYICSNSIFYLLLSLPSLTFSLSLSLSSFLSSNNT